MLSQKQREKIRKRRHRKRLLKLGVFLAILIGIVAGARYFLSDSSRLNFPGQSEAAHEKEKAGQASEKPGKSSEPKQEYITLDQLRSKNAYLLNITDGEAVGGYKEEETFYPASMAKVMTAIVAIEMIGNLDEEVTLSQDIFPDLYEQNASRAGYEPNEVVRAEDLIYGMILPSGGECCKGIAKYVAGSEAQYVEYMNEMAEKIGMKNTNYTNTTGLPDENQYTTAKDMAELLKYCLENPLFREVFTSESHASRGTNIHPDGITVHSTFLSRINPQLENGGVIQGGKTGYTSDAGLCLASMAFIGEKEYVLVTGGADEDPQGTGHFDDAVQAYNMVKP